MRGTIPLAPKEKMIIIPDVHTKYRMAERIIREEGPDRVVFLGDYFDSLNDDLATTKETARWLQSSLRRDGRTHLVGNHDISYMTDNTNLKCSGYSPAKHRVIAEQRIPWDRLEPYCWAGNWLLTHAGLSNEFYSRYRTDESESVQEFLERSRQDLSEMDDSDNTHTFLQAGTLRGGPNDAGGIHWCDYDEFADIPGIRQVFGHTRDSRVRHKKTAHSEHYCIDTVLANYAVYQNYTMTVKETRL